MMQQPDETKHTMNWSEVRWESIVAMVSCSMMEEKWDITVIKEIYDKLVH